MIRMGKESVFIYYRSSIDMEEHKNLAKKVTVSFYVKTKSFLFDYSLFFIGINI